VPGLADGDLRTLDGPAVGRFHANRCRRHAVLPDVRVGPFEQTRLDGAPGGTQRGRPGRLLGGFRPQNGRADQHDDEARDEEGKQDGFFRLR